MNWQCFNGVAFEQTVRVEKQDAGQVVNGFHASDSPCQYNRWVQPGEYLIQGFVSKAFTGSVTPANAYTGAGWYDPMDATHRQWEPSPSADLPARNRLISELPAVAQQSFVKAYRHTSHPSRAQ